MQLTNEIVARYVGGQLEAQNQTGNYLYRGEIATITVEGEGDDATLKVTLNWMAKWDMNRWVNEDELTYKASLYIYSVYDIGDNRIALDSEIMGEITVLNPPDGDKLDPAKVEGLTLTATT
jgi:hypothetical protein